MISRDKIYERLSKLALTKFCDIIEGTKIVEGKLRLIHKKSEGKIVESNISDNPEEGLNYFLEFARDLLRN